MHTKGLLILFATLLVGGFQHQALYAQSTVLWSDSIQIAATPLPVTAPRIFLLPDGTPLAIWGTSSANSQIWCARFENGAFSPAVAVVESPHKPALFGFGGYDVAVSDSQVYVVFEQLQQGIWFTKSNDGGLTFETPIQVQPPISGGYVTIASITADGTGNPVVSYIREKNGADYEIRRSADAGESFGEPVIANTPSPGGNVCECCMSDLLASGDSIWIIYRNNNQNLRDIWVSRSSDLGQNFDIATDADATDWFINSCPISGPRMTRAGDSLFTVWMSQADGPARVYASTLHAGTMQLGQELEFPAVFAQTFPDIASQGDTVGVVLLENAKEPVFYHSTRGMFALNASAQRLAVAGHTLQFPSLAYKNGIFHLVYADATSDQVLYRRGVLSVNTRLETAPGGGLSVFPNPATDGTFSIRSTAEEITGFVLYDGWGNVVFEQEIQGLEVSCRLSFHPVGVYFLKITTEKGSFGIKMVFS